MSNVALNKTATANSAVAPFSAARAVDGNLAQTSRWVGNRMPAWIQVDLGSSYWISRWKVTMMQCVGWASADYNLIDYKLQGSVDGTTWTDIDSITNNTASQTDRYITPRKMKLARVWISKGLRGNTQVASIVELETYEADNSPYLSNLVLSEGALNPTFAPKVFTYSATVSTSTKTITVTPTSMFPGNQIKVNGTPVTSGQASAAIDVANGGTITVEVTTSDPSVKETYTVSVTKPTVSDYLSNLVVGGLRGAMSPPFGRDSYTYTGLVAGGVQSVTVTPTAENSQATIKVNEALTTSGGTTPVSLVVGENRIEVKVYATPQSTPRVYVVVVGRPN
ncbi:MAG: hypothetical protein EHM18_00690 [Acidobacteria bacterium]|nr:MAG: hypothetical protein EHM18_00690 [Acidobacteriota bacterium]